MKEKKPKEKITYIDDGRTIADMSDVGRGMPRFGQGSTSSFKEKWTTYWDAVRMMLIPMLVVVAAILVIYVVMFVLFKGM